jgi:hypothetical protein
MIFWLEESKTAVAYRPVATPPKKNNAKPRLLTLERHPLKRDAFRDKETGSRWDIAGRAIDGDLKGWTLEWLDGVQVNWFAWAAEYPHTTVYGQKTANAKKRNAKDAIKEIAGSAEFLRAVPKRFGELRNVDAGNHAVEVLFDGDKKPTTWKLTPDAEIKVRGWWGRLSHLPAERRVWAWFKVNRSKKPVAIFMLSDELSEQEIHGGAQVKTIGADLVLVGPKKQEKTLGEPGKLQLDRGEEKCCDAVVLRPKDLVFV